MKSLDPTGLVTGGGIWHPGNGDGPGWYEDPITTPPPVVPPATDPPATDPPVIDPPVIDPPVIDPPVIDPPSGGGGSGGNTTLTKTPEQIAAEERARLNNELQNISKLQIGKDLSSYRYEKFGTHMYNDPLGRNKGSFGPTSRDIMQMLMFELLKPFPFLPGNNGALALARGGAASVAMSGVLSTGLITLNDAIKFIQGDGSNPITRKANTQNSEQTRMTAKEARKAAEELGFQKTNFFSSKQPVFTDGKNFITPDIDSHNGGVWKMADSVLNLGSKTTRMGTYDALLNWIGR